MMAHGHQRVRPVLDRHRAVVVAHGRADAGRAHVRRRGWPTTGCSTGWRGCGPSCSARSAPPGTGTAATARSILGLLGERPETVDTATAVDARRRRSASSGRIDAARQARRRASATTTWCCTGAPRCRSTRTACVLRARRRRRAAARADVLLGRRRLRRRRGGGRRRPDQGRRHRAGPSVPHAAPSCSRAAPRPGCRSAASCWPTSWRGATRPRSGPGCSRSGR